MENYQRKTETEKLLEEVLYLLAAQKTPPTLWQLYCVLDAFDSFRRGSYNGAWNRGLDVMATNVAPDPFRDNGATAKALTGISLETLRAGLKAIKVLPVFESINFGPMEIMPDWVKKQPERFGMWEPAA